MGSLPKSRAIPGVIHIISLPRFEKGTEKTAIFVKTPVFH